MVCFQICGWWDSLSLHLLRALMAQTSVHGGSSVLGPSPLGVDTIVRLFNVAEAVSVSGTVSTGGATSNAGRIPRACPARSRPFSSWFVVVPACSPLDVCNLGANGVPALAVHIITHFVTFNAPGCDVPNTCSLLDGDNEASIFEPLTPLMDLVMLVDWSSSE
ncbi:hypothetical protein Tco_0699006 [Tanacetum coccineum]